MKRFFILRHAQAEAGQAAILDPDRHLTPHGRRQATGVGAWFAAAGVRPEVVLCSPAVRTRETLQLLGLPEQSDGEGIFFDSKLYNATPGDLLTLIQTRGGDAGTLLLVGHNPGVHMLAGMLAGRGDEVLIQELQMGYSPATLAALTFDGPWAEISPHQATLTDLIVPA